MQVLLTAAALLVAVFGGWPVTAGILHLAKTKTVRAADAAESGVPEAVEGEAAPATPEGGPTAVEGSGDQPETRPGTPAPPRPRVEVLRGGLVIGLLERAAVAVAILAGQPVAIAYVVAIKGLGRYPELKDTPAASERFIIGTLSSMLWAASVAALAKLLLP